MGSEVEWGQTKETKDEKAVQNTITVVFLGFDPVETVSQKMEQRQQQQQPERRKEEQDHNDEITK
eukprot:m.94438 g.94438  ORF g.94438 m.94438 type:complete len:65 (+) comp15123_c1_seq1:3215-3409(+)